MNNSKEILEILKKDEMIKFIEQNKTNEICELIKSGYDVNHSIINGITPLMMAAGLNSYKSFEMLMSLGANLDSFDDNKHTVLIYTIPKNSIKTAKLILSKNIINIDAKTIYGWTPLMLAIYFNNESMVKLLLKAKANTNICLPDGTTPLELSIERSKDKKRIPNLLIEYGARF